MPLDGIQKMIAELRRRVKGPNCRVVKLISRLNETIYEERLFLEGNRRLFGKKFLLFACLSFVIACGVFLEIHMKNTLCNPYNGKYY